MRQVLSTYDGDLSDPLWWPQERPVPMRVARGPHGIPLPSMPWPNKDEYYKKYQDLAAAFVKNFEKFKDGCSQEILSAAPKVAELVK